MLMQISEYFGVEMASLPFDDWDVVEKDIKKVIKSSRAGKNFSRTTNEADDVNM